LLNEAAYEVLEAKRNSIGAMLWKLHKSL